MSEISIIYCEVRKNNKQLTPGHWFFHTGQWAICAEAIKSKNGKWDIDIHFAPHGKSILEMNTASGAIQRTSTARRIIKYGLAKRALDLVVGSESPRITNDTKEKAWRLIQKL